MGQSASKMGVYLPGVDSGVGEESTPAFSGSESESDYLDYSPGRAVCRYDHEITFRWFDCGACHDRFSADIWWRFEI
jgi:hypothetical protein